MLEAAHESVLEAPLSLLGLDPGLMSNLEVASQAQQHLEAVVASEELEPGDGWPYSLVLGD